jgi:peptidoglycan hydrolase CwlO-like protein
MKKIILIIFAVLVLSRVGYAQGSSLSDRELLLQLYEKVSFINDSITRIENKFVSVENKADVAMEKADTLKNRVTVNEQSILSILEKIKELATNWNRLMIVFLTFIFSIFTYIGVGVYGNRRANHKTN